MGNPRSENPSDYSLYKEIVSKPPREKIVIGPGPVLPQSTLFNIYRIFDVGSTFQTVIPVPRLTIDDVMVKIAGGVIPLKEYPLTRLSRPFIEDPSARQEANEANAHSGSLRQTGRLVGGVAVVLGFSTAIITACSPQVVEVRQAEQTKVPSSEVTISAENTPIPLSTATSAPKSTETVTSTATATGTATSTATVTATSTVTSSPTQEASPTPEGPSFTKWGVYKMTLYNGQKGVFATLPDGTLAGYLSANLPKCYNALPLMEYWTGTYSKSGFELEIGPQKRPYNTKVSAKLVKKGSMIPQAQVMGIIKKPAYEVQKGLMCPQIEVEFEAVAADTTGLDPFLDIFGSFWLGAPPKDPRAVFEKGAGIKLPDSIENK